MIDHGQKRRAKKSVMIHFREIATETERWRDREQEVR